ncbi:MAG TPA: helix-turn-helix transcriptional regulator [Pseudonocardiaceae bacterium]
MLPGQQSEPDSTIRSRELGEALRAAMDATQLTGRGIAKKLGWSQSQVSKLLNGHRIADEVDVSAFLAVCDVVGDKRDALLALARELGKPGWLQQHDSKLPEQVRTLIDHENKAVTIKEFEALVIPGLLQTDAYASGLLLGSGSVSPPEIQGRVAARLGRQSLFTADHRPDFTFLIHELVLHLPVGGSGVMSEQLHHLLRMSVRPYISIRIIPAASGAHAGTAGSFRLMEFDGIRPVVYLEGETSGLYLEEKPEIEIYRRVFGALIEVALDEGQSRDLIARLATDLYADREDHDDRG